jgi:hypothetical protein
MDIEGAGWSGVTPDEKIRAGARLPRGTSVYGPGATPAERITNGAYVANTAARKHGSGHWSRRTA